MMILKPRQVPFESERQNFSRMGNGQSAEKKEGKIYRWNFTEKNDFKKNLFFNHLSNERGHSKIKNAEATWNHVSNAALGIDVHRVDIYF